MDLLQDISTLMYSVIFGTFSLSKLQRQPSCFVITADRGLQHSQSMDRIKILAVLMEATQTHSVVFSKKKY